MIRDHLPLLSRTAGLVLSAALAVACASSTPPPTEPSSAAPVFSPSDLPPGTHVQVTRAGQWYPATIVQSVGVDKFMVSYDGYPPQYNEAVGSDRIKAPTAGGAPGPVRDYRVGEKVLVTSQNRLLLADVVQQIGADQWRVHFDGYGPEVADNVGPDRIRRPFAGTSSHAAGDQVSVDVNGQVLPAKILAVAAQDRWVVRYVGYGPEYDQEIGADRLRTGAPPPPVAGTPPPSPPLAGEPPKPDKGKKGSPAAPPAPVPPPAPPPPPPIQVGDAVAVSQRGVFFPATISAAGSAGHWKVRFEGSTTDEEVAADRVVRASLPAKGAKLQPNQAVLIEWHGVYVPGKVLKEQDKGQYKVRFDGQGPENDEIVAVKRLRMR